jgi:hypothetical protein
VSLVERILHMSTKVYTPIGMFVTVPLNFCCSAFHSLPFSLFSFTFIVYKKIVFIVDCCFWLIFTVFVASNLSLRRWQFMENKRLKDLSARMTRSADCPRRKGTRQSLYIQKRLERSPGYYFGRAYVLSFAAQEGVRTSLEPFHVSSPRGPISA